MMRKIFGDRSSRTGQHGSLQGAGGASSSSSIPTHSTSTSRHPDLASRGRGRLTQRPPNEARITRERTRMLDALNSVGNSLESAVKNPHLSEQARQEFRHRASVLYFNASQASALYSNYAGPISSHDAYLEHNVETMTKETADNLSKLDQDITDHTRGREAYFNNLFIVSSGVKPR